ncbi:MAG TPA: 5-formyltetrahydrofolate cyclo-ligase [Marmoricola sp.]|nr:5-formyltetrahydrofolate cyclo-ligase [Nocardioidaceae bacterium]HRV69811.1 5-formyltetrahydrofolate cyclo-ligase [Marmoricola sp.]
MDHIQTAKLALRDQLLTARSRLALVEIGERARATAEHLLTLPEISHAATIAAYVSVGKEPGTGPLIDALHAAGKRVILPIVLPDLDLDWAVYAGDESLATARRGLLEPTTPPLGKDAIGTADVVIAPGLAATPSGDRLGQGGGCYDRALGRVPVGTPVFVVLNDEEVLDELPVNSHDRKVGAIATPSGVRICR